ncbi:hypothetical protein [Deinococcus rufus]|uniref:Uncharacterized protein n=1 Tax=Deinococcus rufus TaxID=2136097 RepID=A0ABV7Z8P1_9DEIO
MTTPHLSADTIRTATNEVIRATEGLRRCAQELADVEFEFDTAEATALAAGVEGGNEAQRKANLRLRLADQHATVKGARDRHADARRDLDVAQAILTALRYQLRLLEVSAAAVAQ